MTQEQIEKVAEELADIKYPNNSGHYEYDAYRFGVIAGIKHFQPELEALQQENAELKEKLREATEWVNAKKRKPPKDLCVLIQYEDGIVLGCYCGAGEWHCPDTYYSPEDKPVAWRKINP